MLAQRSAVLVAVVRLPTNVVVDVLPTVVPEDVVGFNAVLLLAIGCVVDSNATPPLPPRVLCAAWRDVEMRVAIPVLAVVATVPLGGEVVVEVAVVVVAAGAVVVVVAVAVEVVVVVVMVVCVVVVVVVVVLLVVVPVVAVVVVAVVNVEALVVGAVVCVLEMPLRLVAIGNIPPVLLELVVAIVESHPLHVLSHLSPTPTHNPLAKIV